MAATYDSAVRDDRCHVQSAVRILRCLDKDCGRRHRTVGLDDESRRSVDGAGVGHRELATGESVGSAAGCLCWHDLRRIDRWGGAEAARVIDRERPVTLELPVSGVDKRRGLDGP